MKREVKQFGLIAIAIIAIVGATGYLLLGHRSAEKYVGPVAKITIAYSP